MPSTREKDLGIIKDHWENSKTVSLKDKNLQILERKAILRFLESHKIKILSDLGCGDCSDTIHYVDYADKIYAYDYSEKMLREAKSFVGGNNNILLDKLDLLHEDIKHKSDLVVTKRCLINLGSFENQTMVIKKIFNSLNHNGYYLMLECSLNGLNNLNLLRQKMGLTIIPEPFHNVYFDLNELIAWLNPYFEIESVVNFSSYYFLTRVYNQLLDSNEYALFDKIAADVHNRIDLFGSNIIGPQFMMVLRKK